MEYSMGSAQNETSTEDMTDAVITRLNFTRWLLAGNIEGPVLTTFFIVEFIFSLPLNLFIIVHALFHGRKTIKHSSTFLLVILALTNFLITVLCMPFCIVASASGEWIFGSTDKSRSIVCQIQGFILVYLITSSIHTIAAISVDRCLNIVRSDFHRRFKSWKLSLFVMLCLWLIGAIVSLSPYYAPGFGLYDWSERLSSCISIFVGFRSYSFLQAVHLFIPLAIISITSIWTCIFTRTYLKSNLQRQESILSIPDYQIKKKIYDIQIKNLIGIFGTLLIFNFISYMPLLSVSIFGAAIGFDGIPNQVYAGGFILCLASNVTNPIIQTYFRKDLVKSLKKLFCRKKTVMKKSTSMNMVRASNVIVGPTLQDEHEQEQNPVSTIMGGPTLQDEHVLELVQEQGHEEVQEQGEEQRQEEQHQDNGILPTNNQ